MYKVYAIPQGERNVDLSRPLPFVVEGGTVGRIAAYMWCIKGEDNAILVDTGVTEEFARHFCTARYLGGEKYLADKLRELGVEPADIETVIISHLHSDHFSAYQLYPKATFYVQKKDMEYFTGQGTKFLQVWQHAPKMEEVVKLAYAKRIRFLDGDTQIAPGVQALLVGGHTPGQQIVVVNTARGNAVICSDAMDLYRNLTEGVVGMYSELLPALLALDRIKALASSPELIIPGHEPLVMEKFPNPVKDVAEIG